MALPTASDNPFPSLLITEGTEPSAPAAGKQRLYIDSTTHKLMLTNSSGTEHSVEGAASGAATASGLTMSTAKLLGRTTASSGAIEEIAIGQGLAMATTTLSASATIVTQELGSDQATNNTSTWTDVTGLTGISLVAGTWIVIADVEHVCTTNYGPVFRITDGTNTYAQMGYIGNYLATVSTHQSMTAKPFVLGSTTSIKMQYFTDTTMTIKKYPTRGADSGVIATKVMAWRVV